MPFTLPPLPYAPDAFGKILSAESFEYHHGKHHNAYVTKANELAPGLGYADMGVEQACAASAKNPTSTVFFNQIGQHYNHSLYWNSIKPNGGGKSIPGKLAAQMQKDLEGFDAFRNGFVQMGMTQFGSGWAWLVMDNATGKLELAKTGNADTPLVHGKTPLLVADVWEHAYYIDYRNARQKFLETFVDQMINWENVERLYQAGPIKLAA